LSASVSTTLQLSIYRKLLRLPIYFYKKTKSGEIVSRLFQDVNQAESILTSKNSYFLFLFIYFQNFIFLNFLCKIDFVMQVFGNLVDFISIIVIMLYMNYKLAILGFLSIPLYYYPSKIFGDRLKTMSESFFEEDSELKTAANESLNVDGVILNKLFGREEQIYENFETILSKKTKMRKKMNVCKTLFFHLILFFLFFIFLLFLFPFNLIVSQVYHSIFNFINSVSKATFHWIGGVLVLYNYYRYFILFYYLHIFILKFLLI
jgi:ABC-type multidrug transport system fused ATPase/permease subunit